jgi:hypothetical protein
MIRADVTIKRAAKTLGFDFPVPPRDEEKGRHALAELRRAIRQTMAETGLSEDQLADLFDPTKPLD